jgi:hypothetical protein
MPISPSASIGEQIFVGVGLGTVLSVAFAAAVYFEVSELPLWIAVFLVLWILIFTMLRLRWWATLASCFIVFLVMIVAVACAGLDGHVD